MNNDYHRTMHFTTPGVVNYSPERKGVIGNRLVIDVCTDGLIEYYSYQFFKKFGIKLDKPSWAPHVTVGETSIDAEKYREGDTVVVNYSHFLFWNEKHVWVAADSEATYDLRAFHKIESMDRGHITVGRFSEKHQGVIPNFKSMRDLVLWESYPFNSPL